MLLTKITNYPCLSVCNGEFYFCMQPWPATGPDELCADNITYRLPFDNELIMPGICKPVFYILIL
jgi:hypothetical protein